MINTVEDLINALKNLPPKSNIRIIHEGNQTFCPYLYDVKEMFETRGNVSRGIVEENVSHEESDDFPDKVVVIRGGW